jgi:hypothetical protein
VQIPPVLAERLRCGAILTSDPFTYSTRQHLVFTIGDHEQDSAQMQRYGVHNRRQVPAQFGIVLHRGWLI